MSSGRDEAYKDIRQIGAEVVFTLVDVTAAASALPSASSQQAGISNLQQTHDNKTNMDKKLATLELNQFVLDGSCEMPSESLVSVQTGWWSSGLSGSDCVINEVLSFEFASYHSSIGFTICFDDKMGEFATDFDVFVYNGSGILLASKRVIGNRQMQAVVEMQVQNYKRVKIVFKKSSVPYRRLRVAEVMFGVIKRFDNTSISKLQILREVSTTSEALPSGQMVLTIDNSDRQYNMLNPAGIYGYLHQSYPLDVTIKVNNVAAPMGRYYFTTSTATDKAMTATITANQWLYELDQGLYRKGINATATLQTIVADILQDSGMSIAYDMPVSFGSRVIGWQIPIVSHREALRLAAEAAMLACYVDKNDALVFTDFSAARQTDILDFNCLTEIPKVTVTDRINAVEVIAYSYSSKSGIVDVYKGTINIHGTQDFWVGYSGGANNCSATLTGGTLNAASYYMFGAKLNITATGNVDVVVSGVSLDEVKTIYKAINKNDWETEQVTTLDNPLVTVESASQVAQWVLGNAQRRLKYGLSEQGNPFKDIGEQEVIFDAYNENREAIITKLDYVFDGSLRCQGESEGLG